MKATKFFLIGALGLVLSGCANSVPGLAGDLRLDAPVGSAELRAACADRAQKGLLWKTAIFAGNIVLGPVAGATAGTVDSNPLTANYNLRCSEQAEYDSKDK